MIRVVDLMGALATLPPDTLVAYEHDTGGIVGAEELAVGVPCKIEHLSGILERLSDSPPREHLVQADDGPLRAVVLR